MKREKENRMNGYITKNEKENKKDGYIMKNEKLNHQDVDDSENEVEDVTGYGEFISSYFAWIPPEKQKKRAKELDNITKKGNKDGR